MEQVAKPVHFGLTPVAAFCSLGELPEVIQAKASKRVSDIAEFLTGFSLHL
jgi:hypothetical protein